MFIVPQLKKGKWEMLYAYYRILCSMSCIRNTDLPHSLRYIAKWKSKLWNSVEYITYTGKNKQKIYF